MVAAIDSKSIAVRRAGSIPAVGTTDRAGSRELKKQCFMNNERFLKYYASTPTFRISNPNPRAASKRGFVWDCGDCAIRALANAISCNWLDSFDYLNARARRDYNVCNDAVAFRGWVVESGAVWNHCKAVKGQKRMTVKEFAETHKTGRYVIDVANHFTACVDGVILDVWNPGEKCVVGYYEMANFDLNK